MLLIHFFLKFPVLAFDQKEMDHKLLDHHIHDQMTLSIDYKGNYYTNGYDEDGVIDFPTSENT